MISHMISLYTVFYNSCVCLGSDTIVPLHCSHLLIRSAQEVALSQDGILDSLVL